ncbi:craniofacial development protein 1 isoform X2 [Aphidius gifuensis]|uniref:craniofacial development protein 1 isoform X2 n=1 Tax=Aphidius gifuensis TaxID=684658 RepID=UPI001CDC3956|nr:craniofacial development protein 1 isoform X2 [Aphidius gifuensis]
MSEKHELPSDTDDDDDEDYVPEGAEEPVSEAESEGDVESGPDDENNENKQLTKNNTKKRRNNKQKSNNLKRKKIEVNSNDADDDDDDDNDNETKELTEEEEKKRADLLWADFMKGSDTTTTTPKPVEKKISAPIVKPKVEEKKVKITKIFEFAGEEIKVEKEVPIDSAEARLKLSTTELTSNSSAKKIGNNSTICGGRRGGLGGLSSILSNIGKKTKISTLEKTKLDWDNFKRDEKLDEEITNHNRGKDGYLERQDFLQRTDVRQFEIEKNLRTTRRSNR